MIIKSLLDQDLYKFTMQQIYFHNHINIEGVYEFKSRSELILTDAQRKTVDEELKNLAYLRFEDHEIEFLRNTRFFKEDYLNFLKTFKLNPEKELKILYTLLTNEKFSFSLKAVGKVHIVTMYEIFVLSIINEVMGDFENISFSEISEARKRLYSKKELLRGNDFIEFGTRRRISHNWQNEVIRTLSPLNKEFMRPSLIGTSNVYFAQKYDLTPIGTMAHEFIQFFQHKDFLNSQKMALYEWINEYGRKLTVALTDTLGVDKFIKDFNEEPELQNYFSSFRQDSGNTLIWTEKMKKIKLSTKKTKTYIYSDGLNIDKIIEIQSYDVIKNYDEITNKKIITNFGIGTNLTHDFPNVKPVQCVMKLIEVNEKPVVKISDSHGKSMGDSNYLKWAEKELLKDLGIS